MAKTKTLKLSPALKARWVKALRSGRFKQGAGRLVDAYESGEIGYCCLGVLCAISKRVRDQVPDWESNGLLEGPYDNKTYGYHDVVLPGTAQGALARMNDRGDSFKKIASYIEYSKSI